MFNWWSTFSLFLKNSAQTLTAMSNDVFLVDLSTVFFLLFSSHFFAFFVAFVYSYCICKTLAYMQMMIEKICIVKSGKKWYKFILCLCISICCAMHSLIRSNWTLSDYWYKIVHCRLCIYILQYPLPTRKQKKNVWRLAEQRSMYRLFWKRNNNNHANSTHQKSNYEKAWSNSPQTLTFRCWFVRLIHFYDLCKMIPCSYTFLTANNGFKVPIHRVKRIDNIFFFFFLISCIVCIPKEKISLHSENKAVFTWRCVSPFWNGKMKIYGKECKSNAENCNATKTNALIKNAMGKRTLTNTHILEWFWAKNSNNWEKINANKISFFQRLCVFFFFLGWVKMGENFIRKPFENVHCDAIYTLIAVDVALIEIFESVFAHRRNVCSGFFSTFVSVRNIECERYAIKVHMRNSTLNRHSQTMVQHIYNWIVIRYVDQCTVCKRAKEMDWLDAIDFYDAIVVVAAFVFLTLFLTRSQNLLAALFFFLFVWSTLLYSFYEMFLFFFVFFH